VPQIDCNSKLGIEGVQACTR